MLSRKAGILKGWITFLPLIFCVVFRINAQDSDVESPLEVAIEEINQEIDSNLVFKSYTGNVYDFTNTSQEIRNLGKTLANALGDDSIDNKVLNKYSIMEITNEKDDDLYSAVIISLDSESRVDHIRNLRHILAGFFQQRYGYKEDEANTLAYFLSFYNARYRGDIEYLKSVYKPEVLNLITTKNAGISLDYRDWPGNSRLIIPLTYENLVSLSQLGKEVIDFARENGENLAIKERDSLQVLRQKDIEKREESKSQKEVKIIELQDVLAKKELEVSLEKSKVAEKNLVAEQKRLNAIQNQHNRQGGILEKLDRQEAQNKKDEAALLEEDVKNKEEDLVVTRNQLNKEKKAKDRDEKENNKIRSDRDDEERRLKKDKFDGTINPEPDQQKKPVPVKPILPKPTPVKRVPPKPAPVKPTPPKPTPVKRVPPKPAPVKPISPKPAPVKRVPPKPAPVKPIPPKPAPVKPIPPKPAPVKPIPPKPAPIKPIPPKPAPVKPIPPKPAPVKPIPPKPAPVKPIPPKSGQSKAVESDSSSSSEFLIKDDKLYYMNISASQKLGHYNNAINIIDINKSEVLMSSNDDICNMNYIPYQGGVLVIRAHEKSHEGHHSLSILSLENLQPVLETPDDVNIHWDTPLSFIYGKIYCMISVDGKIYLARFDQKLKLELTSSIEVNESSSMVIVKDRIYANNKGGKSITIFDKDNLSKIGEISIK